ncbi:MAG: hypothetical protein AAGA37_19380 [Actinomycetota bacterium]
MSDEARPASSWLERSAVNLNGLAIVAFAAGILFGTEAARHGGPSILAFANTAGIYFLTGAVLLIARAIVLVAIARDGR